LRSPHPCNARRGIVTGERGEERRAILPGCAAPGGALHRAERTRTRGDWRGIVTGEQGKERRAILPGCAAPGGALHSALPAAPLESPAASANNPRGGRAQAKTDRAAAAVAAKAERVAAKAAKKDEQSRAKAAIVAARKAAREAADRRTQHTYGLQEFMAQWVKVCPAPCGAAELCEIISRHSDLREAARVFMGSKPLKPRELAYCLRSVRGEVLGGLRVVAASRASVGVRWQVECGVPDKVSVG
jgi:hypothetical protein